MLTFIAFRYLSNQPPGRTDSMVLQVALTLDGYMLLFSLWYWLSPC